TPNSPVQSVAEHTVALIFSLLKNIPQYNFQVRNSDFTLRPASNLYAKKVGIIGLGRIGSRVATILECTGCKIQFFDPFTKSYIPSSWNRMDALEALMADSDIITIHSTASPSGKPLIEEKLLSHAKKGIIIINTARGSLIDENALITSLESGQVAGAGLDVFSVEPYKGDLLKFSQVIVTPHVASNTIEARMQMEDEAVNNLIEGLKVRS
ncbi:MAG: NAD(P)-binding domain-containing protein, partial [Deltaproteobacteria bacterium]|nr:NAD(P)-binding domain-containing protein [Deltaproteobacteria bacterium]